MRTTLLTEIARITPHIP
uniref:Uncharacterized protein n=1 Tax=Arundo donax TaxID=35708 RepID=A0A0A8ZBB2_ARUDO